MPSGPFIILDTTNGLIAWTGFPGDSSDGRTAVSNFVLTTADQSTSGQLCVPVYLAGGGNTLTSPFYVSGAAQDEDPGTQHLLEIGGKAVDAASYPATPYNAGDAAMLAISDESGGVLSHIRQINRTDDFINADPTQHDAASNYALATTDGTVFTLAAGERGFIQNCHTAALAVKYGTSAATNSFSRILSAGSAANDGLGGTVYIDNWTGPVSVATMAGSSANYIAWKLS